MEFLRKQKLLNNLTDNLEIGFRFQDSSQVVGQ